VTAGSTDEISAPGIVAAAVAQITDLRAGGNGGYSYGPDGQIMQSISVNSALQSTPIIGTGISHTALHGLQRGGGLVNADDSGALSSSAPTYTAYDRELNGLLTSATTQRSRPMTAPNPFLQKCVERAGRWRRPTIRLCSRRSSRSVESRRRRIHDGRRRGQTRLGCRRRSIQLGSPRCLGLAAIDAGRKLRQRLWNPLNDTGGCSSPPIGSVSSKSVSSAARLILSRRRRDACIAEDSLVHFRRFER